MTTNKLTKLTLEFLLANGHFVMRTNNISARRRKNVLRPGLPDISGCSKSGKALAVEIKNEETNDSLSAAQKDFQQQYQKRGGLYFVIRSADEISEKLSNIK